MVQILSKSFLLLLLFSSSCFAQENKHSFIPQEGKLLVIGQQRDSIDGYIKSIGTLPAGFMSYTSIQMAQGLDQPADDGGGVMYAQYYVNHYKNTVLQLALYMVGALDETLAGQYDGNIVKLAKWLKKSKRPIYLRIGYEFDLPTNHYDPQKYQQAFRYIVDHLRAQGVDNVAYVWHSAAMMEHPKDFMDWYPGDDYVDWFAVSIFNLMQIQTAKEFAVLAHGHQKPLMIAESSPAGEYSVNGKQTWFKHYFDFIDQNDVKIVCYINSLWDSYPMFKSFSWGDARIQQEPQIKEIWLQEMKKGYLQSSSDLFKKLSN